MKNDTPDIEKEISTVLKNEKNGYLNVKDIPKKLKGDVKKQLGFNENSKVKDILKILTPYLKKLHIYQKGNRSFISNLSKEELIINKLKQDIPYPTFMNIRKLLMPLQKDEYSDLINALLKKGIISCIFKNDKPYMCLSKPVSTSVLKPMPPRIAVPLPDDQTADRSAFKTAYDAVRKGRRLVYIYQIREYLDWSRERFDNVLKKLRDDYTIQLHGGDPSIMTENQIQNSFIDENGIRHISISWRGDK